MPEHVRKLSAFVLGGCFVGLLVSQTFLSVGCGRRTVTGQADIKGIYDKVTTGMTVEQVMNLFQPTGPNITRVEADGKISMSWTEKGGGGYLVYPPDKKKEGFIGKTSRAGRCRGGARGSGTPPRARRGRAPGGP